MENIPVSLRGNSDSSTVPLSSYWGKLRNASLFYDRAVSGTDPLALNLCIWLSTGDFLVLFGFACNGAVVCFQFVAENAQAAA